MDRHLVSLGAAITVLALAFEPFFQQSVSFSTRDVVKTSATVSIASSYQPVNDMKYPVGVDFIWAGIDGGTGSKSMALEIANAISTRNQSVRSAPATCPTGRCTWAPYSSLGICHRCQDVSRLLLRTCSQRYMQIASGDAFSASKPCGYHINGTLVTGFYGTEQKFTLGLTTFVAGARMNRSTTFAHWNSTVFQNSPNAILDFYIGYVPGGESQILRNATPILLECLFQWCVKTFEASYVDGNLRERILSTHLPPDAESVIDLGTANNEPYTLGTAPNDGFAMTAAGQTFSVDANTTRSVSKSLNAMLPIRLQNDTLDTNGQYPGRWNFVQQAPYDVNMVMGPIAEAMTNSIRSATNNGTLQIYGNAWGAEVFVQTRWPWIILPALLLISTLVLICATLAKSQKQQVPAWKSSSLATLLHGLTEEARRQLDHGSSQSEVEAASQKIRVKMSFGNASGRLMAA